MEQHLCQKRPPCKTIAETLTREGRWFCLQKTGIVKAEKLSNFCYYIEATTTGNKVTMVASSPESAQQKCLHALEKCPYLDDERLQ